MSPLSPDDLAMLARMRAEFAAEAEQQELQAAFDTLLAEIEERESEDERRARWAAEDEAALARLGGPLGLPEDAPRRARPPLPSRPGARRGWVADEERPPPLTPEEAGR